MYSSNLFQCASIASKLPSQLFLQKSGDFAVWDAKQADITPACRVEPASAEDISLVVKTVTEEGCHFAVKSGGHARDIGFSNADAGVTIDLIRMGSVELSKDKKSVKVGAGARWVDVYLSLEKDNLTAIGGRVADVGVGGLTLGGS
jgi:FAD/FMN-containing dehydrogenase